MPAWPTYLKLSRMAYTEAPDPNVYRTEMDAGPAKQAPRSARHLVARDLIYVAKSDADYSAFRAWFRSDIAQGALWFDWIDPVDGVTRLARLRGGQMRATCDDLSEERVWRIEVSIETWSG